MLEMWQFNNSWFFLKEHASISKTRQNFFSKLVANLCIKMQRGFRSAAHTEAAPVWSFLCIQFVQDDSACWSHCKDWLTVSAFSIVSFRNSSVCLYKLLVLVTLLRRVDLVLLMIFLLSLLQTLGLLKSFFSAVFHVLPLHIMQHKNTVRQWKLSLVTTKQYTIVWTEESIQSKISASRISCSYSRNLMKHLTLIKQLTTKNKFLYFS